MPNLTPSMIHETRKYQDPARYTWVAEYYCGNNKDVQEAYAEAMKLIPDEVFNSRMGVCEHCGTSHLYGTVFKNSDGVGFLCVGNKCAESFFQHRSKSAYYKAQATAAKQRRIEAARVRKNREAFDLANPGISELLEETHDHYILESLKRQLRLRGQLSIKQVALAHKIIKQIADEDAAKAAEPAPVEIPKGFDGERVAFIGTILGVKDQETQWGSSQKMLFKDDRGFKLWGACLGPKGNRVAFTARVEISDKDNCFGFFKRPTQVETLAESIK